MQSGFLFQLATTPAIWAQGEQRQTNLEIYGTRDQTWLPNRDQWPEQPEINETTNATQELVAKRTLAKQGVERDLEMINNMLAKFTYRKLLRVTAYILRFVRNAKKEKPHGPLTTDEIERLARKH